LTLPTAPTGSSDLRAHRRQVTSQWGEEGILEEVFRRIGTGDRTCVELGAGDGKTFSNSWSLWHDAGWRAVLIEADPERFAALEVAVRGFEPKVRAIAARVEVEGDSSLPAILGRERVSRDFDLLSLDIDGDDWHVLAAMGDWRPRCVLVEYNPTIPPEIDVVQPRGERFGASARALVRLAHERRYRLAAMTETNCLFVRDEDFPRLGIAEATVEASFPRELLTYVVTSFDGAPYVTRTPVFVYKLRPAPVLRLRAPEPPHVPLPEGTGLIPVEVHRARSARPG
jgi:hypothetical protein